MFYLFNKSSAFAAKPFERHGADNLYVMIL